jgi:micrococcal nuclease
VGSRALVVVLGAALVALGACAASAAPPRTDGRATVVRVIDGDTIVLSIAGLEEHVRLIGIDTPETKKPDHPVECFGPEASARTSELLPPGTPVRLERDVEARDRFDRLLAYVYRLPDDLFVERSLLEDGYAAPLTVAPNDAHRAELEAASAGARRRGAGLWAACGGPHVPR